MDNWNLHKKELEEIIAEHLAVKEETGEPVDCSTLKCKDCLFDSTLKCKDCLFGWNQCIKDSIRWLNKGDE